MYVVTGATGNTGAIVAERLLDAGKQVRVVVRDAAKARHLAQRGAEVAVADMNDDGALSQALAGARAVYLMSPPDIGAKAFIAERKSLTQRIVRSIARAGVDHVVLLSSIAAERAAGTGPIVSVHNAERQLREARIASTFVRAAYFLENWAGALPLAKQDGVLPAFFPTHLRIPMVAVRDIGPVAAQALLDGPPASGLRILEVAGPSDVSPDDVAHALQGLLGRGVAAKHMPLDAVVPTYTPFGVSQNVAELFREMNSAIADGLLRWEGRGELLRGPTSLELALRALAG